MSGKKTLVLIDGHALAFRQYYALERTGMKNSENQPTWAVYGFFKAIFDLLARIKPDFIAVTFDVGRQTFRVEKYEEYKANREAMPDTLRSQIGVIVEGLKAFDIPIYTKEGYEADDVIGTISRIASEAGNHTLILTGDQDSFQLIDKEGMVKVLIPSKGELIEYNWDKVYEKLGVQSLHTTVIGRDGIPFEVQIRTKKMHQIAEYGVAAHWKYKSGIKESDESFDEKLRWISKLIESEEGTRDSDEFMRALKVDIVQDEIFVFTPKGDVITLPQGAP